MSDLRRRGLLCGLSLALAVQPGLMALNLYGVGLVARPSRTEAVHEGDATETNATTGLQRTTSVVGSGQSDPTSPSSNEVLPTGATPAATPTSTAIVVTTGPATTATTTASATSASATSVAPGAPPVTPAPSAAAVDSLSPSVTVTATVAQTTTTAARTTTAPPTVATTSAPTKPSSTQPAPNPSQGGEVDLAALNAYELLRTAFSPSVAVAFQALDTKGSDPAAVAAQLTAVRTTAQEQRVIALNGALTGAQKGDLDRIFNELADVYVCNDGTIDPVARPGACVSRGGIFG